MPVEKLKTFLEKNDIPYISIKHSPAYTAQEIAAKAHIPGQELAKTVIVKIDKKLAMVVLTSAARVNLQWMKKELSADSVELATEQEFKTKFPECETGAMPPFGNLWGMNVYVSQTLTNDRMIAFNGGSHSELIQCSYKDFQKAVHPTVLNF